MARFDGLCALVTGGASGIGLAAALALHEQGASVATLDLVAATGDKRLTSVIADVTDSAAVDAAVNLAAETIGGLDILINNAGIGAQGTIEQNADEEWHHVLDVNVVGMARVTRVALRFLRESRHAAIVNTCSIAAVMGLPSRALYSASKGAVAALTRAMAADHLGEGIRVNCVVPGTADTPWVGRLLATADDPAQERASLAQRQPHGRLVTAAEIADAILYLASPLSGSTTGVELAVDGGFTGLRVPPLTSLRL